MSTFADKESLDPQQESIQKASQNTPAQRIVNNRPESIAQRKLQAMADNSQQVQQLKSIQEMANNSAQNNKIAQLQAQANQQSSNPSIQQKKNTTGLPDNLKAGVENLSGHSMDDVKVHYNSNHPAQLNAHAYAQGTDIHLGPGQEKHLPHEAWHVVQQKQGRVKPTMQMKGKVNINDDQGLEREADVMGAKALQLKSSSIGKNTLSNMSFLNETNSIQFSSKKISQGTIQLLQIGEKTIDGADDLIAEIDSLSDENLKKASDRLKKWSAHVGKENADAIIKTQTDEIKKPIEKAFTDKTKSYTTFINKLQHLIFNIINTSLDKMDVKMGFELEFYHPKKTAGIRVKDKEDMEYLKKHSTGSVKSQEKLNEDAMKAYKDIERGWTIELNDLVRSKKIEFSEVEEDHKGQGIKYKKYTIKYGEGKTWWYKPTIDDDVLEIIAQPFSLRDLDHGLEEVITLCVFNVAEKLGFHTFKGLEAAKKALGNHMNVDMTTAFGSLENVTKFMKHSFGKQTEIERSLGTSKGTAYKDPRNASFITDKALLAKFNGEMDELENKCKNKAKGYTIVDPSEWQKDIDKIMKTMREDLDKLNPDTEKWGKEMHDQHYMALNAEHIGKTDDPSAWRVEMRSSAMPSDAKELREKINFILKLRDDTLKGVK